MKKIFMFLLLLSFVLIPIVKAENLVEITKIELDSKSNDVTIKNEPTFEGLEMNYDIRFLEVGQFVKYKVTVKNNSSEDYTVQSEETFSDSNYIKYSYEANGVLKSGGSLDVYVTITYNKEIDSDKYEEGLYIESNKAVIKLLNEEKQVVNPNTSSSIIGFVVLVISGVLLLCLIIYGRKHSFVNSIVILIFGLVFLPFIVKAVEELKLSVNVRVEVPNKYAVIYYPHRTLYLTDEELEEKNENLICDPYIFYFGEMTPENKRTQCSGYYPEKEVKYYSFGEKVKVDTVKVVEVDIYDCQSLDVYTYVCPESVEEESEIIDYWEYAAYFMENNGYNYNENDPEMMGFDSSYESFVIDLDSGETFIMPNHDILLYEPRLG